MSDTASHMLFCGRVADAALIYERRQHVINLFVWPSAKESDEAAQKITRKGYNLIHWRQSGMYYCAISDLNDRELREFVQLVQN